MPDSCIRFSSRALSPSARYAQTPQLAYHELSGVLLPPCVVFPLCAQLQYGAGEIIHATKAWTRGRSNKGRQATTNVRGSRRPKHNKSVADSPASRLLRIMRSQSAMCLRSSTFGFGGRYVGRVLLTTFWKMLGPIERVTRWRGDVGLAAGAPLAEAEDDGVGGSPAERGPSANVAVAGVEGGLSALVRGRFGVLAGAERGEYAPSEGVAERWLVESSEPGGSSSSLEVVETGGAGSTCMLGSGSTSPGTSSSRLIVENLEPIPISSPSPGSGDACGDNASECSSAGDSERVTPASSSTSWETPILAARSSASYCASNHSWFTVGFAASSCRRESEVKWKSGPTSSPSENASSISSEIPVECLAAMVDSEGGSIMA